MTMKSKHTRIKRVLMIALAVFISLALLEMGSFLVLRLKDRVKPFIRYRVSHFTRHLDPYEQLIPDDPSNFMLVPNFRATYRQMLDSKEKGGHWFGANLFRDWLEDNNVPLDSMALSVNTYGFRGPEIFKEKSIDTTRIIALGDSCTFGIIESDSYPRALEKMLKGDGAKVEVINAGVEGYGTKDLMKRLDYFLQFEPDIATIYIGWNGINYESLLTLENFYIYLNSYRLINKVLSKFKKTEGWFLSGGLKGKFYKKIKVIDYKPTPLRDVFSIVKQLKDRNTKIVLFTLPSLFDPYTVADTETLKLGHLPPESANAYLYGYAVYAYNDALRRLADEQNLYLIDLEKFADENMRPKKNFFLDTSHLHPFAQKMLGEYIAKEFSRKGIVKIDRT